MDERNVRYPAGPKGEGKTHRVGLTRHCLTSGLVQLPYALKDSLPEGALLAHDLERDESIEVVFVPPRSLEGLEGFFEAHELLVNDEIELRLVDAQPPELRIVPLRRTRSAERTARTPTSSEVRGAPAGASAGTGSEAPSSDVPRVRREPSVWHSVRDDGPTLPRPGASPERFDRFAPARPQEAGAAGGRDDGATEGSELASADEAETPERPLGDVASDATLDDLPRARNRSVPSGPRTSAPSETDPDVVERFGSVTVRRLGGGSVARPSASRLATTGEPAPNATSTAPRNETPAVSEEEQDAPEPVLGIDPDVALATPDPADVDGTDIASAFREPDPSAVADVAPTVEDDVVESADGALQASEPDSAPTSPVQLGTAEVPRDDGLVNDVPADDVPADDASADDEPLPADVRQASLFDLSVGAPKRTDARQPAPSTPPAATPISEASVETDSLAADPVQADPVQADPATEDLRAADRTPAGPAATKARSTASLPEPPRSESGRSQAGGTDQDRIDVKRKPKVLGRLGRTPHGQAGTMPAAAAQREREEALSRAGDLRSRIIRWMLAPDTPVIVSTEQVQEAFGLPADVARDIVEGILESPPPALRLTRLRTDLLRVSRITVEQNA